MPREITIRLLYVTDATHPGDGEGWRYYVSGTETACGALGDPETLPEDAPLHEVARVLVEALTPPALTPLQQEIAGLLAQEVARQGVAGRLGCSRSAVDQVARRVQGEGRRGRPRRASNGLPTPSGEGEEK